MPVSNKLQVCCLVAEAHFSQTELKISQVLPEDRYSITIFAEIEALVTFLTTNPILQDCLVIFNDAQTAINYLGRLNVFLPIILVLEKLDEYSEVHYEHSESQEFYRASISISYDQLQDLPEIIDQAIATFIKIPPQIRHQVYVNIPHATASESLSIQQQRLAEKLNERLGYLGVYYKRDSRLFLRNLSPEDRKDYIVRLKNLYRAVVLQYFLEQNETLNQKIDEFVNLAFFADISVSQVLEIHMELMDEFANQLRLEGRSDEILLDYRITLIDMIAHLCELYRRSIPRS
ncbi:MAG: circadian clock protein KaiA [Pseudanabaenaceae cyanobacterium bins.39]|nr:circadian clock protein KaiA [Pseudanabaenaceae cyanobacterium bins.39]